MKNVAMHPRHVRLTFAVALVSSFALLAGCQQYPSAPEGQAKQTPADVGSGNPNTQAASVSGAGSALKSGTGFSNYLAKGYYDAAVTRQANKDWVDADFFGRKSMAVSNGQMMLPEDNARWSIPGQGDMQTRTQMTQQRNRLIAALDGGGRDKFPQLASKTQVEYDCWIERTEQNFKAEWHGQCYNQYMADMADLEVALHPPMFKVMFDFGSDKLTPASAKTLADAAAALPTVGTSQYLLVGHTDTVGSPAANLKLSQRRSDAVQGGLVKAGVPANRITTKGVGENQLPVQTADNTKEARNRVVDIIGIVPGVTQMAQAR